MTIDENTKISSVIDITTIHNAGDACLIKAGGFNPYELIESLNKSGLSINIESLAKIMSFSNASGSLLSDEFKMNNGIDGKLEGFSFKSDDKSLEFKLKFYEKAYSKSNEVPVLYGIKFFINYKGSLDDAVNLKKLKDKLIEYFKDLDPRVVF